MAKTAFDDSALEMNDLGGDEGTFALTVYFIENVSYCTSLRLFICCHLVYYFSRAKDRLQCHAIYQRFSF